MMRHRRTSRTRDANTHPPNDFHRGSQTGGLRSCYETAHAIAGRGFAPPPERHAAGCRRGGRRTRRERIPVDTGRVDHLAHRDGQVEAIAFADGASLPCGAVFFTTGQYQQDSLAQRLGCRFNRRGTVRTDLLGRTSAPGLFVVGDASHDVQFVVVAAAEGAKAAVAINHSLQEESGLVPESLLTHGRL